MKPLNVASTFFAAATLVALGVGDYIGAFLAGFTSIAFLLASLLPEEKPTNRRISR